MLRTTRAVLPGGAGVTRVVYGWGSDRDLLVEPPQQSNTFKFPPGERVISVCLGWDSVKEAHVCYVLDYSFAGVLHQFHHRWEPQSGVTRRCLCRSLRSWHDSVRSHHSPNITEITGTVEEFGLL
ncbi:hypothetical protein ARMSODRAFT_731306 [Armillaria solidipes]|uniref:Uncharacterized protein n=1 Tax=Armillaria solidipes TaxID=1076256 RepID=A0A2H3AZR4_9AGAR|nr:hypothetical protein ARMSODRAFT_731306 [Armillaria solidipes]